METPPGPPTRHVSSWQGWGNPPPWREQPSTDGTIPDARTVPADILSRTLLPVSECRCRLPALRSCLRPTGPHWFAISPPRWPDARSSPFNSFSGLITAVPRSVPISSPATDPEQRRAHGAREPRSTSPAGARTPRDDRCPGSRFRRLHSHLRCLGRTRSRSRHLLRLRPLADSHRGKHPLDLDRSGPLLDPHPLGNGPFAWVPNHRQ